MILADTNAVLALLVPGRSDEQTAGIEGARQHGPVVVTESVLAETCWVLESVYAIRARDIADLLRDALDSDDLIAWDPALARAALEVLSATPELSIVDSLLAARAARGDVILTFDRRLGRVIEGL